MKCNPPLSEWQKGIIMPNYRRAYLKGGTYFFTVVTYRRYPIFMEESAVEFLMGCFKLVADEYPFRVDAMVILPDHIHCIWTLPDNDFDFSVRWKRLKACFSRNYARSRKADVSESMRRKKEKGIWQRRFWEHCIRDQEDFNRHCDYIHYNPVKHELVNLPMEWKYSSFEKFVRRGRYSEAWGQTVRRELMEMDLE